MNYFTHGLAYVAEPWLLAGTALPDWLAAWERPARLRRNDLQRWQNDAAPHEQLLATGALKHLQDDQWFHSQPAFYAVCGQLTLEYRKQLGDHPALRCSLAPHIALEMLLDARLAMLYPERLDQYYDSLRRVDGDQLLSCVSRWTQRTLTALPHFWQYFVTSQYIRDYAEDAKVLNRLNQVLTRVPLSPLPPQALGWIQIARKIVYSHLERLLPAEHYTWPQPPPGNQQPAQALAPL
ncbi:MAG: hypothetical protein KatS3mg114_0990 [Planctomycetaceae bacterium]|nr:MAG: hypothetical protein KatS3mg114_0990 [Planctomycetaceae bacterium]